MQHWHAFKLGCGIERSGHRVLGEGLRRLVPEAAQTFWPSKRRADEITEQSRRPRPQRQHLPASAFAPAAASTPPSSAPPCLSASPRAAMEQTELRLSRKSAQLAGKGRLLTHPCRRNEPQLCLVESYCVLAFRHHARVAREREKTASGGAVAGDRSDSSKGSHIESEPHLLRASRVILGGTQVDAASHL